MFRNQFDMRELRQYLQESPIVVDIACGYVGRPAAQVIGAFSAAYQGVKPRAPVSAVDDYRFLQQVSCRLENIVDEALHVEHRFGRGSVVNAMAQCCGAS